MTKKILVCLIIFLLYGCDINRTVDIKEAVSESKDKSECVDTRDGEKFTVWIKDLTEVKTTFTDTCLIGKDSNGIKRTLCKSYESTWLKCK